MRMRCPTERATVPATTNRARTARSIPTLNAPIASVEPSLAASGCSASPRLAPNETVRPGAARRRASGSGCPTTPNEVGLPGMPVQQAGFGVREEDRPVLGRVSPGADDADDLERRSLAAREPHLAADDQPPFRRNTGPDDDLVGAFVGHDQSAT